MAIKVCLFGDPGVGKTSIIERMRGNPISSKYSPDLGYGASWIQFGGIMYDVWDCAGSEPMGPDAYTWLYGLDLAIIVYDHLSTPASIDRWLDPIHSMFPEVPIILCRNKADIDTDVDIHPGLHGVSISAKDDLDLHRLWTLAQELMSKTVILPKYGFKSPLPADGDAFQDQKAQKEEANY